MCEAGTWLLDSIVYLERNMLKKLLLQTPFSFTEGRRKYCLFCGSL